MTIEKLRRLWYLSTMPTHSRHSLQELHELVREAVSLLVDCGRCVHWRNGTEEYCNDCVEGRKNNFELRMEDA